jgi:hypothetical protein
VSTKKTTVGEGGNTPSWRRVPEHLSTWLPKSQAGTPPPDWKAVAASAYEPPVYYDVRLYVIRPCHKMIGEENPVLATWEVEKQGVIINLETDEYAKVGRQLYRALTGQELLLDVVRQRKGLHRDVSFIQYPPRMPKHTFWIYREAILTDARVNTRNTELCLNEDVYYE